MAPARSLSMALFAAVAAAAVLLPLPHPGAAVVSGPGRFTVLAPALIRLEYEAGGRFDDRPTLTAYNRRFAPLPQFTVQRREDGGVTITTSAIELVWGGGPFTPGSLTLTLRTYPFTVWHPGKPHTGNLHGTIRTLDRVGEPLDLTCTPPATTMEFYAHCEEGVVSRDGWAVLDDSLRPRVQVNISEGRDGGRHVLREWPWPVSPPEANVAALQAGQPAGPYTDLYFFGFGLDHVGAVASYTALGGPIPLLPAYALGAGFSRWFAYSQTEELEGPAGPGGQGGLLSSFEEAGVPLDLLSIDMDWCVAVCLVRHLAPLMCHPPDTDRHTTGPRGERSNPVTRVANEGWTGWTWQPLLFPAPAALFSAASRRGIAVNLNSHPADGVAFDETAYPAMARAVGVDPSTTLPVTFDPANQSYVAAFLEHVQRPIDDLGLAFWWQDFQHGPFTTVPLLNPTYMTNLLLWENPWRYGARVPGRRLPGAAALPGTEARPYVDRPFLFGRWSGYGSHRMPIGFAGDTAVKWRVLRYESYFDTTASNVAFSWSNDIGGFEGAPPPELLVRWSQWGALSAMLRGHSSKMSPPRTAWSFPHPFFGAIRLAWRMRAALLPYLRAAQRDAYESGLQMLQPTYWHYPGATAAYGTQAQHQYFLGPGQALWVAPVAAPAIDDGTTADADLSLQARVTRDTTPEVGKPTRPPFSAIVSAHNGRVPWTVWVPPGAWIEWGSWQAVRGAATPVPTPGSGRGLPSAYNSGTGSYVARNYSLAEIPMFSPPGAIIARRVLPGTGSAARGRPHPSSPLGLASHPLTDLALWVMPLAAPEEGATEVQRYGPQPIPAGGWAGAVGSLSALSGTLTSRARLYEDDGSTMAAVDGHYADSAAECTWARGPPGAGEGLLAGFTRVFKPAGAVVDTLTCVLIEPTGKGYAGHPAERVISWRFIGVWPPASVVVDGMSLTAARDQAGVPDNSGEHGAWEDGTAAWGYHGASASVWVHVPAVPTRPAFATVSSDGRTAAAGGAVHTVVLRFEAGARLDEGVLTRHGLHRLVSRSLTCKEDVDRAYGLVYPSDIPHVLNVSSNSVRLGQASSAAEARGLMEAMVDGARLGGQGVAGWAVPEAQRTMRAVQAHCIGALADGLARPTALLQTDARAVAADRPISFKAGISAALGSAPGQVSQHEGSGESGEKETDTWEGKGWTLLEGGRAEPPTTRASRK